MRTISPIRTTTSSSTATCPMLLSYSLRTRKRSFMKFTPHYGVQNHHARLSASKYSWLNYDLDQLDRLLTTAQAAALGTRLHALAQEMIKLGVWARNSQKTFNMYVNDCIGYRMEPEVVLFYSVDCFGTV